MNILFTGASSCTGMHFVDALLKEGHHLICTFTKKKNEYTGIRAQRIQYILPHITPLWSTHFGDEQFLSCIKEHYIESYAHHMAWTQGYATTDYDIDKAVRNNTYNLKKNIDSLTDRGCQQIILTNSVFEGEYVQCTGGSAPFEPHGWAKKKTTELFSALHSSIPIRRFIIPNPFGTFDRIRLVESLHCAWSEGRIPHIHHPDNIRDNIPIPILTEQYVQFHKSQKPRASPSGIITNNKDFVTHIATELKMRCGYSTPVVFGPQIDLSQPSLLANTEPQVERWNKDIFWDELAEHFLNRF
jgi:UDP-glucose 4-epimerase